MWLPLGRALPKIRPYQWARHPSFFYSHGLEYRKWVIDAFKNAICLRPVINFQIAADSLNGHAGNHAAPCFFSGPLP